MAIDRKHLALIKRDWWDVGTTYTQDEAALINSACADFPAMQIKPNQRERGYIMAKAGIAAPSIKAPGPSRLRRGQRSSARQGHGCSHAWTEGRTGIESVASVRNANCNDFWDARR
jgi:hypothetical protein